MYTISAHNQSSSLFPSHPRGFFVVGIFFLVFCSGRGELSSDILDVQLDSADTAFLPLFALKVVEFGAAREKCGFAFFTSFGC